MNFQKVEQDIKDCKRCTLWKRRINPVIGEGDLNTDIMFIGEAPGFNEDKQGKPFVGQSGKILDKLLESVNLKRQDIYIANILKCRPPKNRNPTNEEISSCSVHLDKQIEIIRPKIICCLGNFATGYILRRFDLKEEIKGISKIHGRVFDVTTVYGEMKIIPF
jgi:DNA polymerase